MEVMSFNLWSDAPRNRSWPRRRELITEVLRRKTLSLAGLQEATAIMIADLHIRLPEYSWVGAGRDDGVSAGEHTPIFYRTDHFSLLAHGHFWLAEPCDLPRRGWDAHCHRIATWVRLREKSSDQVVTHLNTHFDHLGRTARTESARLIVRKIAEIAGDGPAILTGDLNCRETSKPYLILAGRTLFGQETALASGMRDARFDSETSPAGPSKTYRGLLGTLGLGRIDYIFVRNGLRTRRYAVLEEAAGASDHRPVLAELAFTTSP